jgi:hypothetical protein
MTYCHRLEINMLVIKAMSLEQVALMVARIPVLAFQMTPPLPLEGTTKADTCDKNGGGNCNGLQVYGRTNHKLDSSLPKQPLILQDVKRLNEFALVLCCRVSIPEHDS